jgi:hypothetical protein
MTLYTLARMFGGIRVLRTFTIFILLRLVLQVVSTARERARGAFADHQDPPYFPGPILKRFE